jgi:hypothetical protein
MSEQTVTTNTPAPAAAAFSAPAEVKVETQVTNQVETTQTPAQVLNQQTTPDVTVKKPEPKVEPQNTGSKLDYSEMISKAIDGAITPEDIAAIEQTGLSKEQFQMMADAQKAIQTKNNDTLYNVVGGKESYESLKSFAAEHLSDDEIDGFNSALRSGNMKIAEMAVLGLKAMAERERGRNPQMRLGSDGNEGQAVAPYASQQDLIKDLNSRQYRIDPVFKATVDARRNKSGF